MRASVEMEYVANLKGYKRFDGAWFAKEIAYVPLHKDVDPVVKLIQTPVTFFDDLARYDEEIPYGDELSCHLKRIFRGATKIIVKDWRHKEWFDQHLYSKIKIEDLRLEMGFKSSL
jgi:hypothetical protein